MCAALRQLPSITNKSRVHSGSGPHREPAHDGCRAAQSSRGCLKSGGERGTGKERELLYIFKKKKKLLEPSATTETLQFTFKNSELPCERAEQPGLCVRGRSAGSAVCTRAVCELPPSPPSQWAHSINLKKLFVGLMNRQGVLSQSFLRRFTPRFFFFPSMCFSLDFPFLRKISTSQSPFPED